MRFLLPITLVLLAGCEFRRSKPLPAPVAVPPTAMRPAIIEDRTIVYPSTELPNLPSASPARPVPQPARSTRPLPAGVIFGEYFDDLAGSQTKVIRGERTRDATIKESLRIYPFYDKAQQDTLVLTWTEDAETKGPDDKPGVLAITWETIPEKLSYSGFAYVGRLQDGMLSLPQFREATSADKLRGVRVRFRYRTINPTIETPRQLTVGVRIEAMVEDSYKYRLDLGRIIATQEWSSFEADLGESGNIQAFVDIVNEHRPNAFKILFAQAGNIENYAAGDTLLIDDFEFAVEPSSANSEKSAGEPEAELESKIEETRRLGR